MNVLITGSRGLIGSALVSSLRQEGHEHIRLVRSPAPSTPDMISWAPDSGQGPNASQLEGLDAVIHLAGENVARRRWTPEQKARIRNSRVQGTALLAQSVAELDRPPAVFVSASAIGYYGDRGDEILTESSPPGNGFLADIVRDWEAAVRPVEQAGIRAVQLRIGMVLSPDGGALARMLPLFKWGLGGVIGGGKQYISWISIHDTIRTIRHIMKTETLRGPVNIVAPTPVTNRAFTKSLGISLKRPTILPVPAMAIRFVMGEMADELVLGGCRVHPEKLLRSGFVFEDPELSMALKRLKNPTN